MQLERRIDDVVVGGAEGFWRGSLQTALADHGDVMGERDDDAPVRTVSEAISHDSVRVSLDLVVIALCLA